MSGTAFAFLNNLKVGHKLSLGFGLILLFTALIAGTAWWSLERLSARANQFDLIATLDSLTRDVSLSVLTYRHSHQEADRAKVLQDLERLRTE